jgi:hypothetical protein
MTLNLMTLTEQDKTQHYTTSNGCKMICLSACLHTSCLSAFLPICPSVFMSVHMAIWPSVSPSAHQPVSHQPVSMSACQPVSPQPVSPSAPSLSACQPVNLSVFQSVCLYGCLAACTSICLYLPLYVCQTVHSSGFHFESIIKTLKHFRN